ncbi:BhlA/UviB family holin-like peptide [Clostridium baratii]|uniref:BhlA/UviB family holin-like peptide n=1 Tax=Clostridium baratii TaxID=1561 RepID=UPI003BAF4C28
MKTLENELIKIAMSQGIWAVLSIFLIIYILKVQEKRDLKQDEREKNYFELIENLTEKMKIISNVNNNVEEIKEKLNI